MDALECETRHVEELEVRLETGDCGGVESEKRTRRGVVEIEDCSTLRRGKNGRLGEIGILRNGGAIPREGRISYWCADEVGRCCAMRRRSIQLHHLSLTDVLVLQPRRALGGFLLLLRLCSGCCIICLLFPQRQEMAVMEAFHWLLAHVEACLGGE